MTQQLSHLHDSLSDHATLYISGPMTGIENFNYPFFDSTATQLRKQGFEVLSPSEIDKGAQIAKDYTEEKPYSYYLKKAMFMMCQADAIVMLEGWTQSKGARRELDFMLDCGMPAFRLEYNARESALWLVALDAGMELSV